MYCNNCGKEIKENAKFCIACGNEIIEPKKLNISDIQDTIGDKRQENLKKYLLGGILVAIALVAIIVLCILDGKGVFSNSETIKQNMVLEQSGATTLRKEYIYDNDENLYGYSEVEYNEDGYIMSKREYYVVEQSTMEDIRLLSEEKYIYILNSYTGFWEKFILEKSEYDIESSIENVSREYEYKIGNDGKLKECKEFDKNTGDILQHIYYEYTYEDGILKYLMMYDMDTKEEDGFFVYRYDEYGRCIGRDYKERDSEGFEMGHSIEWIEWEYDDNGNIVNEIYTLYETTYDYIQIITKWDTEGKEISRSFYDSRTWDRMERVYDYDSSGKCVGGHLYTYNWTETLVDTKWISYIYEEIGNSSKENLINETESLVKGELDTSIDYNEVSILREISRYNPSGVLEDYCQEELNTKGQQIKATRYINGEFVFSVSTERDDAGKIISVRNEYADGSGECTTYLNFDESDNYTEIITQDIRTGEVLSHQRLDYFYSEKGLIKDIDIFEYDTENRIAAIEYLYDSDGGNYKTITVGEVYETVCEYDELGNLLCSSSCSQDHYIIQNYDECGNLLEEMQGWYFADGGKKEEMTYYKYTYNEDRQAVSAIIYDVGESEDIIGTIEYKYTEI